MLKHPRTQTLVVLIGLLFISTAAIPITQAQGGGSLQNPWQDEPLMTPLTPLVQSTQRDYQPYTPPQTLSEDTPIVVHLPSSLVTMVLTFQLQQSYLNTTLSNVPAGYDVHNGWHYGWCGDYYHYINVGIPYQVTLYSTYDPALPTYLYHQNWSRVNYILNHKIGTAYQQVQSAIWYILNCGNQGLNANGWAMVNAAIANGTDYVPAPGGRCAVLAGVNPTVQRTLFEVVVPGYSLTTATDGQGTITTDPSASSYVYGQSVELTAAPEPGWTFDHWTGDAIGTDNPVSITMDADKTATAVFTQIPYDLTVTIEGDGSFDIEPDQPNYTYGQVVSIMAAAEPGWSFSQWTGDVTSTDNPVEVTIAGNLALTAVFTQNQYSLTVNVDGDGYVTVDPDQVMYTYNQVVELTATAGPGWTFDHWAGDASGSSETASVTITDDSVVAAYFTQDQYTLTVTAVGSGSFLVEPLQDTYTYSSVVSITALSEIGWTFDSWGGDASGTDETIEVAITRNTAITGLFTHNQYSLTLVTEGNGTISADPDQDLYYYGDIVQLTAQADPGWTFENWGGDASGNAEVFDIIITGSMTATATFSQDHYTLTLDTDGEGMIVAAPEQDTYVYGTLVTLTAAPALGWSFDHWTGAVTGSTSPVQLVMTGNAAVTAVFTQNLYTLSVSVDGSGVVAKDPDQATYTYGQTVNLAASASAGWQFSYWSGDATGSTNPVAITITDDMAVTAHFTQDAYSLTINTDGDGQVTVDPDQATYAYGDIVELTAVPGLGWSFDHWDGDASGTNPTVLITITGDTEVSAYFTQDQYILSVSLIGDGTVENNPNQEYYTYGQTVELTATAADGWTFEEWSGDASGGENPIMITMDSSKDITAEFTQNQYTLIVTVTGNGTVAVDPEQETYTYGAVVVLTAQPAEGSMFVGWSGDASGTTNPLSVTITKDTAITATFSEEDLVAPLVDISQPQNGIYLLDRLICPFTMPLFFHNLTVIVNASDAQSGIDRVEIFVDNVSTAVLTSAPYEWVWTEQKPMKHQLKAIAYDNAGNSAFDSVMVWRWRYHPVIIALLLMKLILDDHRYGHHPDMVQE